MIETSKNTQTPGQFPATELMDLIAAGDSGKAASRVRELSVVEFAEVLRAVRKLEDLLVEYSDQWKDAYTWGRGMPYPDEDGGEANAEAGERFAGAALQAVA